MRRRRIGLWYLWAALAALFILALPELAWDVLGDRYSRVPPRPSLAWPAEWGEQ